MDQKAVDPNNDHIHGDLPRRGYLRRAARTTHILAFFDDHLG